MTNGVSPNGSKVLQKNIIEGKSQDPRNHMLYYLADIMSDATNFSWQNAKAAHTVLLCDMERGAVSWQER